MGQTTSVTGSGSSSSGYYNSAAARIRPFTSSNNTNNHTNNNSNSNSNNASSMFSSYDNNNPNNNSNKSHNPNAPWILSSSSSEDANGICIQKLPDKLLYAAARSFLRASAGHSSVGFGRRLHNGTAASNNNKSYNSSNSSGGGELEKTAYGYNDCYRFIDSDVSLKEEDESMECSWKYTPVKVQPLHSNAVLSKAEEQRIHTLCKFVTDCLDLSQTSKSDMDPSLPHPEVEMAYLTLVQFTQMSFPSCVALPSGLAECIYTAIANGRLRRHLASNNHHTNLLPANINAGTSAVARLSFLDYAVFLSLLHTCVEDSKSTISQNKNTPALMIVSYLVFDVVQRSSIHKDGVLRFMNAIYGNNAWAAYLTTSSVSRTVTSPDSDSESAPSNVHNSDVWESVFAAYNSQTNQILPNTFVDGLNVSQFVQRLARLREAYTTTTSNQSQTPSIEHIPSHPISAYTHWLLTLYPNMIQVLQPHTSHPKLIPYYAPASHARYLYLLCSNYGVHNLMLFEVKRKFHGWCEFTNSNTSESSSSGSGISMEGFVYRSVNGNHLPEVLAKLVFASVNHTREQFWECNHKEMKEGGVNAEDGKIFRSLSQEYLGVEEESEGRLEDADTAVDNKETDANDIVSNGNKQSMTWSLYQFLQFGCKLLRRDASNNANEDMDMEAMRLLHAIFRNISVSQIRWYLHLYNRYSRGDDFADSLQQEASAEEAEVLPGMKQESSLSLEEFMQVFGTDEDMLKLLQGLRCMVGCEFGIRPYMPLMERQIIEDIFLRHKRQHPTTHCTPRGPSGTDWYILQAKWWKQWLHYSKSDNPKTGATVCTLSPTIRLPPIDNHYLLKTNSLALKANLMHLRDFELVPPLAWQALQSWHDGGPPIVRRTTPLEFCTAATVLDADSDNTKSDVELHPWCLTITIWDAHRCGMRPFQQWALVSKTEPLRQWLIDMAAILKRPVEDLRVYHILPMQEGDAAREADRILLDPALPICIQQQQQEHLSGEEDGVLEDSNENIHDVQITDESTLMLELADAMTHTFPLDTGIGATTAQPPPMHTSNHNYPQPIIGLHNLGNTCYFNTILQCLSHTPLLSEYFTTGVYAKDINMENPMGYKGQLARSFAELVLQLCPLPPPTSTTTSASNTQASMVQDAQYHFHRAASSQYTLNHHHHHYKPMSGTVSPHKFKDSIGRLNDLFQGNEQHDAQELLAFLLSGLAEDLNLVSSRPYVELPDSDGIMRDSALAAIWWKNHLSREQSLVTMLFTGQYKSVTKCTYCKYASARFEPFVYLQLPLGMCQEDGVSGVDGGGSKIRVRAVVYLCTGERRKVKVRVNMGGYVRDLIRAVAVDLCSGNEEEKMVDGMVENLSLTDVRDGRIVSITPHNRPLSQLREGDALLHIYELQPISRDNTEPDMETNTIANAETKTAPDQIQEENDKAGDDNEKKNTPPPDIPTSATATPVVKSNTKPIAYLALCQRRPTLTNSGPMALPYGTPILLRVQSLPDLSSKDIYRLIASRYPEACWKAGRYNFDVKFTSRDGKRCSRCPWINCCTGCVLPYDADGKSGVTDGDTLALDWKSSEHNDKEEDDNDDNANNSDLTLETGVDTIQGRRGEESQPYSHNRMNNNINHQESEDDDDIRLEECLDAFAHTERIADTYCSRCKAFHDADKSMQLWRLPPIAIINLKRFHYGGGGGNNNSSSNVGRKLRQKVSFPVRGLDLGRIVADKGGVTGCCEEEDKKRNEVEQGDDVGKNSMIDANVSSMDDDTQTFKEDETFEEKNDENDDVNDSHGDTSSSSTLYDLYGIVHHLGALHGGHYVASLRSNNNSNKWLLYNDAQISDISENDIVDASAYILFYIRQDVKDLTLSDVWHSSTVHERRERYHQDGSGDAGEAISDAEERLVEQIIRQRDRCVIS